MEDTTMTVDPALLEILVCPVGLGKLKLQGRRLVCTQCGAVFRIEKGGIPNMLIDDAELPEGITDVSALSCWQVRHAKEPDA